MISDSITFKMNHFFFKSNQKKLHSFSDNSDQEDEGDVPMAQRKRFTRVEMARVLMERNQVSVQAQLKLLIISILIGFKMKLTRNFIVQRTIHGTSGCCTMDGDDSCITHR